MTSEEIATNRKINNILLWAKQNFCKAWDAEE